MAVFRVEKTKDFTVMCNHHLRNVKLSLKAKGLLSLMLSLPEDWDYTTKGLACICRDGVDSIASALKELILSKRPFIRIAGDDFPREVVKSRFLKINSGHLEYVFDCIDKNTTKVGNIKAYLLAALYNAPATMDSYYRAEVNHDLYGM